MKDIDVTCPHCGVRHNAATGIGHDHSAEPGALNVCFDCGGISEFGKDLQLRELSPDDFLALPDDVRISLASISRDVIRYQSEESS